MKAFKIAKSHIVVLVMTLAPLACIGAEERNERSLTVFDSCAANLHPARMTDHENAGQPDHCEDFTDFPEGWSLMTNWGTKPQWYSSTSFVFVSNLVGDVFRMDVESGEIDSLTSHFPHAGFTRVHVLSNGDLLLLGPSSGSSPPKDPLVPHDTGMFTGDLFILRQPFDGEPFPLHRNAWEGIAVSRKSMQIAWSTTDVPFYAQSPDGSIDLLATGLQYLLQPTSIRTGRIVFDSDGIPRLEEDREVISKWSVGAVFLEPQDFAGPSEELLLVSAYGIVDGFGDRIVVDMADGSFEKIDHPLGAGYDEWEGVHPSGNSAFVEVSDSAIGDPEGKWWLYLYNLATGTHRIVTEPNAVGPHEPVFSKGGRWVLTATTARGGWPGYSVGTLLIDMKADTDSDSAGSSKTSR
jgi:hypothetical protein